MAELNVNKVNILDLFSGLKGKKFTIPEFQRPYAWEKEQAEVLWDDIVNFYELSQDENSNYFLGAIVSSKSGDGENNKDIIDGQQRLTTLSLLLRAFYYKLEKIDPNNKYKKLRSDLESCLWEKDSKTGEPARNKVLIKSLVVTNEEYSNDIFHEILETGLAKDDSKDKYSINYIFFQEKCEEYARNNPIGDHWLNLLLTFLNRIILLPIECEDQEDALMIFTTLNNRGLSLNDVDIFKSEIYKSKNENERKDFIEDWENIISICERAGIEISNLFNYYMHVLRAGKGALKGTPEPEISLRKFFIQNNYEHLRDENLISNIIKLAELWERINNFSLPNKEEDGYTFTYDSLKYIHVLKVYPNEYWSHLVNTYFLKNFEKDNFSESFENIIKKIIAYLYIKFMEAPGLSHIKYDVSIACINIWNGESFWNSIDIDILDTVGQTSLSKYYNYRTYKGLILLHAYLNVNQKDKIGVFDIEHIIPRKNDFIIDKGEQKYIEFFGNKVILERKVNTQAGNKHFFEKKLRHYKKSNISDVVDICEQYKEKFTIDDIKNRDEQFAKKILTFFKEQFSE